ncbi:MAG: T9SS type A sorting domain-containing protein [Nitrososphaerales archaeon]
MTQWVGITERLIIDSGSVEYIILDSLVINDSTVQWSIEERKNILHVDSVYGYGNDTTYWILDTTIIPLIETTTLFHQINIISLIWHFPLIYSSEILSMNRFSNSSNIRLEKYWASSDTSGFDTLFFNTDLGLYYRSTSIHSGPGHTHITNDKKINLKNKPVLSIPLITDYPKNIYLEQNYPNPFNPTTTIKYSITHQSTVKIVIYDILGRIINILLDEEKSPGDYEIKFNARDLATGIYFYQLRVDKFIKTKKMLLIN